MLFYTHIVFSVLIGLFFVDYFSVSNKIIFFVFLVLFSSFPDIDKSNSKIGKRFSLFSKLINFVFGHRNFFHSLLFLITGYLVISVFSDLVGLAFLVSVASHLVLDALTPSGVAAFYPLKYRVKGWIKTGSLVEKLIFLAIIVLIIVKLSTGHA